MGTISAVRITDADNQLVTQADQDKVAASLKDQLCSHKDTSFGHVDLTAVPANDATCDAAVDAAVEEALPLQYQATDQFFGLPMQDDAGNPIMTDTKAFDIVQASVELAQQGVVGTNWAYTVHGKVSSKSDVIMAADGTVDRYCDGSKTKYETGIKVTYGINTAFAPLYSYVEKIAYKCMTPAEIAAATSEY